MVFSCTVIQNIHAIPKIGLLPLACHVIAEQLATNQAISNMLGPLTIDRKVQGYRPVVLGAPAGNKKGGYGTWGRGETMPQPCLGPSPTDMLVLESRLVRLSGRTDSGPNSVPCAQCSQDNSCTGQSARPRLYL